MRGKRGFLVVAVLLGLAMPSAAAARTFEVTKKGDTSPGPCTPSDCSLREAVLAANARPGADRIVLPSRGGAYRLGIPSTGEDGAADGDLDVTNDPLQVVHRGKGLATIDGQDVDRVFHVFAGAPLRVSKIEIRDGANPTNFDGSGGGILADSNVTLIRSRLISNRAVDDGGGISIRENSGASLTLKRSQVTRNVTGDDGGGVAIEEDNAGDATGKLVISRSKITRNRAIDNFGGGVFVQRPSRITKTTVDRNRGDNAAGIGVENNPSVIKDTAVTRNVATGSEGGGLELAGPSARLTNVTVAKNRAAGAGGGIINFSADPVRLNSVTIVGNVADTDENGDAGAGINGEVGTLSLDNTIVADNRLGDGTTDACFGTGFESGGHNLANRRAASCSLSRASDDLVNKPAGLGRLGRNGGPTETVPLKASSKAIGKAGADAPGRDQRGVKRRNPDIGAFER